VTLTRSATKHLRTRSAEDREGLAADSEGVREAGRAGRGPNIASANNNAGDFFFMFGQQRRGVRSSPNSVLPSLGLSMCRKSDKIRFRMGRGLG